MDNRLRELRQRAGYKNISDLAAKLGVSRSTVSMWESGDRELYLDRACDICDILNCSLDELAGRKSMSLSATESQLIRDFRSSDARGQAAILAIAQLNRGTDSISVNESLIVYGNG